MSEQQKNLASALQTLIGKPLTSAEFVHDYFQLRFPDEYLLAYNHAVLKHANHKTSLTDPTTFFQELSTCVGRLVVQTQALEGEHVTIAFDNSSSLQISLRDEDYRSPEAIQFRDASGLLWVA